MDSDLHYKGYNNTPLLWNDELFGIQQYAVTNSKVMTIKSQNVHIRLGLLVEQFVFDCLNVNKDIKIIATNIQVIEDKKTLGELDCLIIDHKKLIHLEVAYKFYLYDPTITGSELDKWIGPNRKDSLKQKLNKLKSNQMPLLHHPKTKEIIKGLDYDSDMFIQKSHFKGQLFLPFGETSEDVYPLNKACIYGYYITLKQLVYFNKSSFYIPSKLDWLIEPHDNVSWRDIDDFTSLLMTSLNAYRSPMCWIKDEYNKIQKIFIVFW